LQLLAGEPLDAPLFAAHSRADRVAPIAGIDRLIATHAAPERIERVTLDDRRPANCRVLESDCVRPAAATPPCGVTHASVVLAAPIRPDGAPSGPICEAANPRFDEMARAAVRFLADLP
jgi:hypothetical protein